MSKCKCINVLLKKKKLERLLFFLFVLVNHFTKTVNGKVKLVSKTKLLGKQ